MPAQDVSVSATFEEEAKPNFADTFNVTVDGSKTEIGTELTATVTANADETPLPGTGMSYQWYRANDGSSDGTEIVGETENTYTLAADDVDKYVYVKVTYAGEDYAADNNVITSNKVGAVTMKTIADYDFDTKGDASVFEAGGTGKAVAAELASTAPSSEEDKSVKFTQTGSGQQNDGMRILDLTEGLKTAKKISIEYDSYCETGNYRLKFGVLDENNAPLFWHGQTGSSAFKYYSVATDSETAVDKGNQMHGMWNHTTINVDYTTGKMKVRVAVRDGGEDALKEKEIDLGLHRLAKIYYADHNNGTTYIDNIKVSAVPGEEQIVTIKYVDKDSNADVKTSDTVTWVKGLPFSATDAMKANFDDKTPETKRYIYQSDSTDSIDSVDDDNNTITLKFQTVEYTNVEFTVNVAGVAKQDVPIKITGSPACDSSVSVDKTITTAEGGKASIKLLPTSDSAKYTYTIDDSPNQYKGETKEFETTEGSVTVNLEKDEQKLAAAEIDKSKLNSGTILQGKARDIGYVSTIQYSDNEKATEMVTPSENVEWTVKKGASGDGGDADTDVTIDEQGKVSISDAATGTYQITAKVDGSVETDPITITLGATGTETIGSASEDFEGKSNIFGATVPEVADGHKACNYPGIYDSQLAGFGKILNLGSPGDATNNSGTNEYEAAGVTAKFATPIKAVNDGDIITITFNPFVCWNDTGSKEQSIVFKNGDADVISIKRNTADMAIYSLKFGETEQITDTSTALSQKGDSSDTKTKEEANEAVMRFTFVNCSNGGSNKNTNGWDYKNSKTQPYLATDKCTVTITINTSTGETTAKFESVASGSNLKARTVTRKGTIADFSQIDSVTLTGVNGTAGYGQGLGFDNLKTTVQTAE